MNGTPSDAQTGNYGNIMISVRDGSDTVSLPAFSVRVDAAPVVNPPPVVNTPPVISGSPATSVTAGDAYSFQPNASDADGNNLTFSISGRPSWASFNTATGRLSGTPSDAQTGNYSNIVISVRDGTRYCQPAGLQCPRGRGAGGEHPAGDQRQPGDQRDGRQMPTASSQMPRMPTATT